MDGGPSDDNTFQPDPPKKVGLYQVGILFIYHVLLAIILAYSIYKVWPPQPWPGDRGKTAAAAPAPTQPQAATNSNNADTGAGAGTTNNNSRTQNANSNANASDNNNRSTPSTTTNANSNTRSSNANSATSAPGNGSNPVEAAVSPYGGPLPPPFTLFFWEFQPALETRLILLVLLAGAIGSYVHAASSFVDYLGNRTLISSWVWWYLLRPFIGMMLALIFYFVFRGGFITGGVSTGSEAAANFINPFGIAAMAGLVGMFSKVAADKLNEVFLTLFKPATGQGDAKRGDKLADSLTPNVSSLSPATGPAAGGTLVTINGTGFLAGAKVTFGSVPSPTVVVVAPTSLTAITPPHAAGVVDVEVTNTNNQKGMLKSAFTFS